LTWRVPTWLPRGQWSLLVLQCFLLALQSPLSAHCSPRRVPMCCRLALRWMLSAMLTLMREHQWRQQGLS
jgi:hypothetical protein